MAAVITISKFQTYPRIEPTGYAVGFTMQRRGRQFYRDTTVSFAESEGMTEEQICDVAFEKLRAGIQDKAAEFGTKGEIVGEIYTPQPEQ